VYNTSFDTMGRMSPIVILAVVLLEAITFFTHGVTQVGASVFAFGFIALIAHRVVLLDEDYGWSTVFKRSDAGAVRLPIWGFFWRYGLLVLVFSGVLMALSIYVATSTEIGRSQETVVVVFSTGFVVSIVMAALVGLIGTVLPAAAVGGDTRFAVALQRGRKRFWKTMGRFVAGPVVVFIVSVIVMGGLAMQDAGHPAAMIILGAMGTVIGVFNTVMVATILSMSYREAEAA
jgi:hypothetical protein